jgi:hypothetical protein
MLITDGKDVHSVINSEKGAVEAMRLTKNSEGRIAIDVIYGPSTNVYSVNGSPKIKRIEGIYYEDTAISQDGLTSVLASQVINKDAHLVTSQAFFYKNNIIIGSSALITIKGLPK